MPQVRRLTFFLRMFRELFSDVGAAICCAALLASDVGLDFPLISSFFEFLLETVPVFFLRCMFLTGLFYKLATKNFKRTKIRRAWQC